MSYGSDTETPAPEPAPAPASEAEAPAKTKRGGVKLTDKQKTQLKKHMDKLKEGGMGASELKSHRMKMMSRMKKGMSVAKSHKDINQA